MPQYYDIHCHIFNKDFLMRHFVNIALTLSAISDDQKINKNMKVVKKQLKKIREGLNALNLEHSRDVFKVLDDAYDNEFIVTPLSMNLIYADDNDGNTNQNAKYIRQLKRMLRNIKRIIRFIKNRTWDNENRELLKDIIDDIKEFNKYLDNKAKNNQWLISNNNYKDQIKEHAQLAKENPRVKPFLALDPRTQRINKIKLIDLVKEHFEVDSPNFYGIKLYPPIGFSPTDPILMGDEQNPSIYGYCIDKGIPITVHNSNSGFSCFSNELFVTGWAYYKKKWNRTYKLKRFNDDKIEFRKRFFSIYIGKAIKERATVLNHPKIWEKVLEKFPNLTINFAHFGGSSQIMEMTNREFSDKFKDIDIIKINKIIKNVERTEDKKKVIDAFEDIDGNYNIKSDLEPGNCKELWEILYKAGVIDNWSQAIFDIISNDKYPNAYTDLSCFRAFDEKGDPSFIKNLTKFKKSFFDQLDEKYKEKILYGTDFFLILLSGIDTKVYVDTFNTVFGNDFDLIASVNPERFLGVGLN